MRDFFYRLLRPRHWVRNYSYDENWDAFVRQSISDQKIVVKCEKIAMLSGVPVWIGNYPYAYGTPYPGSYAMPSAQTVDALRSAIVLSHIRAHQ